MSSLRDLHSNLTAVAVIFCQNDSVALRYPEPADKLLLLDKELLAREQKGQAEGKDAEEKAQAQADAKVRRGTALRHARAGTH
jgi:hypothetical protein